MPHETSERRQFMIQTSLIDYDDGSGYQRNTVSQAWFVKIDEVDLGPHPSIKEYYPFWKDVIFPYGLVQLYQHEETSHIAAIDCGGIPWLFYSDKNSEALDQARKFLEDRKKYTQHTQIFQGKLSDYFNSDAFNDLTFIPDGYIRYYSRQIPFYQHTPTASDGQASLHLLPAEYVQEPEEVAVLTHPNGALEIAVQWDAFDLPAEHNTGPFATVSAIELSEILKSTNTALPDWLVVELHRLQTLADMAQQQNGR